MPSREDEIKEKLKKIVKEKKTKESSSEHEHSTIEEIDLDFNNAGAFKKLFEIMKDPRVPEEVLIRLCLATSIYVVNQLAKTHRWNCEFHMSHVLLLRKMGLDDVCEDYNGTALHEGDYLKTGEGKKKVLGVYHHAAELSEVDQFEESDGIWWETLIKDREFVLIKEKPKKNKK